MKYISNQKLFRTCPWTSKRATRGHVPDTNNNDNNIIIYFINKYKGNPKSFSESMEVMRKARADEKWDKLTKEEQMNIQNQLMRL